MNEELPDTTWLQEGFGPFGSILYSELPVQPLYDVPPRNNRGHYVAQLNEYYVTGETFQVNLNYDYVGSPALPAYAEFHGIQYDQSLRYAPYYNSPFFLHPRALCVLHVAQVAEAYVEMIMQLDEEKFRPEDLDDKDVAALLTANKKACLQREVISCTVPQDGSRFTAVKTRTRLLLDVLRNENLMLNWFEEGLGRLNNAAAFVQDRGIDYVQTKTDNPHALFAINTIELSDIADFYTQRPNGIDLSALDGHSRKECWKLLNGKHTEEQEDRLRAATETLGPYLKKYTR